MIWGSLDLSAFVILYGKGSFNNLKYSRLENDVSVAIPTQCTHPWTVVIL